MKTLKQFALMLGVAAMVTVGTLPILEDADARRSGGFSSSRSSFSSSRSTRSVSRSTVRSSSKKKSGGFFSSSKKSGSLKTGGTKKTGLSGAGRASTTKKALTAKQERTKFKQKPATVAKTPTARNEHYRKTYASNPVYTRANSYDRSTYYDRRSGYLGRGYHSPMYVYGMSPSYGMLDTIIMVSMLNNLSHSSSYAYHHRNDADYRLWRREMDSQARENAELRGQLAAMDAKVNGMSGAIDPSYVPKGLDADLLLSEEARVAQAPEFRVCVGGTKGAYHRIATTIMNPGLPQVNMVPVNTTGTPEILAKVASGECDGGFVQSDGYWNFIEDNQTTSLPFTRITSTHKEAVHLICNANIGESSITDLDDDHSIYFPKLSGAATTYLNWVEEDDDYMDINTVLWNPAMEVANNTEALLKAVNDKNSCMMYVAAPGASKFMLEAEKLAAAGRVKLMEVDDWDFNDTTDPSGSKVYTFGKMQTAWYPSLLEDEGKIEVPFVNADFIVSDAWRKKHTKIYANFSIALIGLQPEIDRILVVR